MKKYITLTVAVSFLTVSAAYATQIINNQVNFFPSFTPSATTTSYGIFNPTFTMNTGNPVLTLEDISPTINSTSGNPVVIYNNCGGTINQQIPLFLYTINCVHSGTKFLSSAGGVAPTLPDTFFDGSYVEYSGGTPASTPWHAISYISMNKVEVKGAGSNLSVGEGIGFFVHQNLSADQGTLTVPEQSGFFVDDLTKQQTNGGIVNLPLNTAIHIKNLTAGTKNLSMHSEGPSVELWHAGPARFGSAQSPRSTLDVDGSITVKRTAVNDTNYTVLPSDYLVAFTNLTAQRTVILPNAATADVGKVYIIKDESGRADKIPISLGTVDGGPLSINSKYGSMRLYSNGAGWFSW